MFHINHNDDDRIKNKSGFIKSNKISQPAQGQVVPYEVPSAYSDNDISKRISNAYQSNISFGMKLPCCSELSKLIIEYESHLESHVKSFHDVGSFRKALKGKPNLKELIPQLLQYKTSQGKVIEPRYLKEIIGKIKPDNIELAKQMLNTKSSCGGPVFDSGHILSILENATPENQRYLTEMLDVTKEHNHHIYGYQITELFPTMNDEKMNVLKDLVKDKRFLNYSCASIIKELNPLKKEWLYKLLQEKSSDGKMFIDSGSQIDNILGHLDENSSPTLEYMFSSKDKFKYYFSSIFAKTNSENVEFFNKMAADKKGIGVSGILNSLEAYNPESKEILESILEKAGDTMQYESTLYPISKGYLKEYKALKERFIWGTSYLDIFGKLNEDNVAFLPKLLEAKDSAGKYIFDSAYDLEQTLYSTNKKTDNTLSLAMKSGAYSAEDISIVMDYAKRRNPEFVEKLVADSRLSPDNVRFIAGFSSDAPNADIEAILKHKTISGDTIANIYCTLTHKKDFNLDKIMQLKVKDGKFSHSIGEPINDLQIRVVSSLARLEPAGIPLKKMIGNKGIESLNLEEKKTLFYSLARNNFHVDDTILLAEKAGLELPLIPKAANKTDFMTQLAESVKYSFKPRKLDALVLKDFNSAIVNIEKTLKHTKIEDVSLRLLYPRERFTDDLADAISKLPEEIKEEVFSHYGFKLIEHVDGDKITRRIDGYPMLPEGGNTNKIALETKSSIDSIITKFTEKNKIILPAEFEALEKDLNDIAKAFPEFLTTVGKAQHGTHQYTLDKHILKVLQETISHPDFEKLSPTDKKLAKTAILLHDISKKEGIVDKEHPLESALDAFSIISKLDLSQREKERVYSIIKNHHWVEELAKGERTPEDIAFEFRRPNDFDIAKIFAKADLIGVGNKEFYEPLLPTCQQWIEKVQPLVDNINAKGIFIPQTNIPRASQLRLPLVEIGAEEQKTVNKIVELSKSQNLEAIGFDKGASADNFYGIIHTIPDHAENAVGMLDMASKEGCEGVLSTSLISGKKFDTYSGRKFGLVFDVDPGNIGVAYPENVGSGYFKDVGRLKSYFFKNKGPDDEYRRYFSEKLKKAANLSEEEYKEVYKKLAQCKDLSDIQDPKLRAAVKETTESLFKFGNHNEIVSYAAKPTGIFVKNIQSSEEIPYQLRKYAQDNDLPIILFG